MIKTAVLGTGFIANVFAWVNKDSKDIQIEAVLGINQQDADEYAQKHNVKKAYADYDQLLQDPDIDMVYVGLPNHLHFPFALKAVQAGKNAAVEKPFVSTSEEAAILAQEAKKNGVMVFDAITTKYMPLMETLKENLKDAGDIRQVLSEYCQYSSRYDAIKAGEIPGVFDLKNGGGALKDLGIYPLTFFVSLFGSPNDIHYYANKLDNGCDVSGTLILEYDNMVGTIRIAKDSFAQNRCSIEGTEGSFYINDDCFRWPDLQFQKSKKEEPVTLGTFEGNGIANEFSVFARMLENGEYDANQENLKQTGEVLDLLDKAAKSAGLVYGK